MSKINHLVIELYRERGKLGNLHAFSEDGEVVLKVPCLGKADNQRAKQAGNPSRDPTKPYGDTPTGFHPNRRIYELPDEGSRLGRYVIMLDSPSEGEALIAKRNGRTGMAIHGGRGDDRLVPTYGCVRLLDKDLAQLARLVGDGEFSIEVIESD